jgi:ADP-ribose pyrophosphatase YjhB (NUDIX family)
MFFGMPEDHLQVLVSAKAIIWNGGRVLLARNSRLEWDLPGGKVKLGETIESALRRELQEELAVELVSQELISDASLLFNDPCSNLWLRCYQPRKHTNQRRAF